MRSGTITIPAVASDASTRMVIVSPGLLVMVVNNDDPGIFYRVATGYGSLSPLCFLRPASPSGPVSCSEIVHRSASVSTICSLISFNVTSDTQDAAKKIRPRHREPFVLADLVEVS